MKLSASTLGCPGRDIDEIIALYRSAGIKGLEIRGIGGEVAADKITCLSPEHYEETLRKLKENDITPICFGTSISLHNREKFDANVAEGLAAIRLCERTGIPFIRVFGNDLPDKEGRKEAIETIAEIGTLLCNEGEKAGVQILMEIHGTINTVENLIPVLDALGPHPAFGIIWDVMHTDRAYGDKWDPVYRLIRPFIKHVHIKDHERNSTPPFHLVPLGEGDIPLEDIVNRLRMDGYDGYFSFEWEKMWHPDLAEAESVFPHFTEYMKRF